MFPWQQDWIGAIDDDNSGKVVDEYVSDSVDCKDNSDDQMEALVNLSIKHIFM